MIKTEKSLFSYLIILTYKRSVYKLHSEKTLVIVSIFSLSGPAYILDVIFFRHNFLICLYILIRVVWWNDLWPNHPYENM